MNTGLCLVLGWVVGWLCGYLRACYLESRWAAVIESYQKTDVMNRATIQSYKACADLDMQTIENYQQKLDEVYSVLGMEDAG